MSNTIELILVVSILQAFKSSVVNKFSAIDKTSSREKVESSIDNELKIIMLPDTLYKKWVKIFEMYAKGDLISPDTSFPYRESKSWTPPNPLPKEFFKIFQGMNEYEMDKLATNILMLDDSWTYPYPKVVIRRPTKPKACCYLAKDWSDRIKRKRAIINELSLIKPNLELMEGIEVNREKWRNFKQEFGFNGASMSYLMREAGSDFLSKKVTVFGRNTQLSDEAKLSFKSFLNLKKVVNPGGMATFNKVNEKVKTSGWSNNISNAMIRGEGNKIAVGIIDFRLIPGSNLSGSIDSPFHYSFIKMIEEVGCPRFTEVPTWVWICDDNKRVQVEMLYQTRLIPFFDIVFSTYVPGPMEALTRPLEMKKSREYSIAIMILLKKEKSKMVGDAKRLKYKGIYQPESSSKSVHKTMQDEHKYTIETDYELRMDFYIDILQQSACKRQIVFNFFGGSKIMYAGMVSITLFLS